MSIKKDLKARGLFINKRKRRQMISVAIPMMVSLGVAIALVVII